VHTAPPASRPQLWLGTPKLPGNRLLRAAQQPAQDVAPDIYLANYFLRYAFCVVIVPIEAFWVRWSHRSDHSSDSQLARSRVRPEGKPVASYIDRRFNAWDLTPCNSLCSRYSLRAFLPTLIIEPLPGADLFPTWTAPVVFVTRQLCGPSEPAILPPESPVGGTRQFNRS